MIDGTVLEFEEHLLLKEGLANIFGKGGVLKSDNDSASKDSDDSSSKDSIDGVSNLIDKTLLARDGPGEQIPGGILFHHDSVIENRQIKPGHTRTIMNSNQPWKKVGIPNYEPLYSFLSGVPLISNCDGWNQEDKGDNELSIKTLPIKSQFFSHTEIYSWLGRHAEVGPMALSIGKIGYNYSIFLQYKNGEISHYFSIKKDLDESKILKSILPLFSLSLDLKKTKKLTKTHFKEVEDQEDLQKKLKSLEENQTQKGYKFGLVLSKNQSTDDEIFSNEKGSCKWDRFLNLMGVKILLRGWEHYKGGLDIDNDTTGTHSIYTNYQDNEVMFHVSTMLPSTANNTQQIDRKRHVGNDICVVVFQDGKSSYSPDIIKSHFIHLVIVVQDIGDDKYKVAVSTKDGVELPIEPSIPENGIIGKEQIRDFILTKLINGEQAALCAPVFADKLHQARETLLQDIFNNF